MIFHSLFGACVCLAVSQPGSLDTTPGTQEIPEMPGPLGSVTEKPTPYYLCGEFVPDNSEDI